MEKSTSEPGACAQLISSRSAQAYHGLFNTMSTEYSMLITPYLTTCSVPRTMYGVYTVLFGYAMSLGTCYRLPAAVAVFILAAGTAGLQYKCTVPCKVPLLQPSLSMLKGPL